MSNVSDASVGTTKTSLVKRRTIVPSGNDNLTTTVLASGNSKRSTGASGTTLLSQLPRLGLDAANRSQPYLTSADVMARPLTGGRGSKFLPPRSFKVSVSPSRAISHHFAPSPPPPPPGGRPRVPGLALSTRP